MKSSLAFAGPKHFARINKIMTRQTRSLSLIKLYSKYVAFVFANTKRDINVEKFMTLVVVKKIHLRNTNSNTKFNYILISL